MTKKRVGLLAIVAIMVVCVLGACLTACGGLKAATPNDVIDHIISGFEAATEDMTMDGMGVNGNIGLTVQNGEATHNYNVVLNANVAIGQDKYATAFELGVKEGDKDVFYLNYKDSQSTPTAYLMYNDTKVSLRVPSVGKALKVNAANVSDPEIEANTIRDGLGMVFGMLTSGSTDKNGKSEMTKMSKDGTKVELSVPLTDIIGDTSNEEGLGGIVEDIVKPIFTDIGLSSTLNDILPYINLTATVTFDKNKDDNGRQKATGLSLALEIGKKDIVVNKVATDKGALLTASIPNDIKFSVDSTFNCYLDTTSVKIGNPPGAASDYGTQKNLLNAAIDASLELKDGIKQDIAIAGVGNIGFNIPVGTYTLDADLDVDAAAFLHSNISGFTKYQTATANGQTVYYKKGTGNKDALKPGDLLYTTVVAEAMLDDAGKPSVVTRGVANPKAILDAVSTTLATSYIKLELKKDGESYLNLTIDSGKIKLTAKDGVLTGLGATITALPALKQGVDIFGLIGALGGIIPGLKSITEEPAATFDFSDHMDDHELTAEEKKAQEELEKDKQPAKGYEDEFTSMTTMEVVKDYVINPLKLIINGTGLRADYSAHILTKETGKDKTDADGNVIYKKNSKGEFLLDEDGNKIAVQVVDKSMYLDIEVENVALTANGFSIAKLHLANSGSLIESDPSGKFDVTVENISATVKLFGAQRA